MGEHVNRYHCNECNMNWEVATTVSCIRCPNCSEINNISFMGTDWKE